VSELRNRIGGNEMINHGEFKSVRSTTNHLETTDQGQQDYDGPAQCAEPSKSETATRRATSIAGPAGTLPRPVTNMTVLKKLKAALEAAEAEVVHAEIVSSTATAINDAYNAYDIADAAYDYELMKQRKRTT
jgi:hypothetical protein